MAEESGFIQEELYRNSNFVHPRNKKILYYDCTKYYFETEQDDDLRKYGKSKKNRPNPIVTMGLFMDADEIPLAFDVFPGNQNEQTTLKPLETKIIRNFACSGFKMRGEDRQTALDPKQFHRLGSDKFTDIICRFALKWNKKNSSPDYPSKPLPTPILTSSLYL